jgi:hypothetical protein
LSPSLILKMLDTMPERFGCRLAGSCAGQTLDGWSPLEHAVHVRDELHVKVNRLSRVLTEDSPLLDEANFQRPPVALEISMVPGLLAALVVSRDRLARLIAGMTAADRGRAGSRRGRKITAWQLALEATHEGMHHLTAIDG